MKRPIDMRHCATAEHLLPRLNILTNTSDHARLSREPAEEKISVSKFKATCPEVLQRVNKTRKPVLVTRYGVPIAKVSPAPHQKRGSSWRGSMIGTGRILGDIVSPAGSEDDWKADVKILLHR